MSGRLDEIRERWAPWPSFDIGDDGDLWCGDVRIGAVDAGTAEEAITNAPADVAWLVGQVEELGQANASLAGVLVERDEAKEQLNNLLFHLREVKTERDEVRRFLEKVEGLVSGRLDALAEARGALDALAFDHARIQAERDKALRELATLRDANVREHKALLAVMAERDAALAVLAEPSEEEMERLLNVSRQAWEDSGADCGQARWADEIRAIITDLRERARARVTRE